MKVSIAGNFFDIAERLKLDCLRRHRGDGGKTSE
jgi:hypothetical protein